MLNNEETEREHLKKWLEEQGKDASDERLSTILSMVKHVEPTKEEIDEAIKHIEKNY